MSNLLLVCDPPDGTSAVGAKHGGRDDGDERIWKTLKVCGLISFFVSIEIVA